PSFPVRARRALVPSRFSRLPACPRAHSDLPSFPTRRSSDLHLRGSCRASPSRRGSPLPLPRSQPPPVPFLSGWWRYGEKALEEADRKSTRLNSSHVSISYAVFCLKKKDELTVRKGVRRYRLR